MRKTYAEKLRNVLSASIASGQLSEVLNELSTDELEFISHDWELWARDEQLAPSLIGASRATSSGASGRLDEGESEAPIKSWRVWLLLGGRGSGKTRAGAEWVRSIAGNDKQARIALVGKTLGDVRNVMIEGQSGLLAIHPAHERPEFEPSKRRLTWPNGAVAELFSADEAEALRGPQFTAAWCDELAKWRGAERAWDMLQFALRLGEAPRVCVTTTPRATKLLKQIIADEATVTVNIATADNATNLAPTFLAEMTRRYAGSAIGRQELLGEIVEDASDGLWRRHWIEEARVENAPEMQRVVVALDPPVTATASSDACGIVVAGLGVDKRAYILADRTIQGRTPELWARAALGAYDDFEADRMVAEVNQGGDLVISVLQQFRENFPVVKVRATRGKWVRAEPVAALYAEGRVAHVGRFDALEDQMCAFGSDGTVKGRSPDRADALVWALTDLLLSDRTKPSVRML
ncbi:terminase family protein [Hyphomicrobium sp.]|uniref:DNA-packaging protein n=1 Tax=Hyphomicrobium sp. TaxID=82 RepID=UPI0025B87B29|nr:terminase family protein [Hyphomicrobium sp.]